MSFNGGQWTDKLERSKALEEEKQYGNLGGGRQDWTEIREKYTSKTMPQVYGALFHKTNMSGKKG